MERLYSQLVRCIVFWVVCMYGLESRLVEVRSAFLGGSIS